MKCDLALNIQEHGSHCDSDKRLRPMARASGVSAFSVDRGKHGSAYFRRYARQKRRCLTNLKLRRDRKNVPLKCCQMLTDLQNSFTNRLGSSLWQSSTEISHHISNALLLKNRCVPQLSDANCHARVSHSNQLLKNIHPMMFTAILFTDEKIFTVVTPKISRKPILSKLPV